MDAEIAELQRLLAAAQAEDVSRRLNDRNCIELVTKLINLGMITVIRTNGGEYVHLYVYVYVFSTLLSYSNKNSIIYFSHIDT